jgi:epoxyqueuosine reductase
MADAEARIKVKALELGFTKVGIARAEVLDEEGPRLVEWLSRGYHAGMAWMARNVDKRTDPRTILAGANSVIAFALNYYTPVDHQNDPGAAKISRYAWGDDYHNLLGDRLNQMVKWMMSEFPDSEATWYVDTGPMMDKVWAQRAGIGWEGKHTNVITQEVGSWVFLGEIITTLVLKPDHPAVDHCGTCTLCIEACPTEAIVAPYVVDSHRCISYLTIEHRGDIDAELSKNFEGWIYGCDICQDVCPWNHKFAAETSVDGFSPRGDSARPILSQWGEMTGEEFSRRFKGSPIKRTKHEGLLRNIGVVASGKRGG